MAQGVLRFLRASCMVLSCAGCGGGDAPPPVAPSLGAFGLPAKTYGDPPFDLAAPASNSAGRFSFSSDNPLVATVSGQILTVTGAGTATISAQQAADGDFSAAQVTATLTVDRADPGLGGLAALTRTYADPAFDLPDPRSASSAPFEFSCDNPAVATISGRTVTIVGAGHATVTVRQAASNNFNAAQLDVALSVVAATPTLGAFAVGRQVYGSAPFTPVLPGSDSPGAMSYTSSEPAVATIDANTALITIVGAGTTTITARQAPTTNYVGSSATATLVVDPAVPTVYFPSIVKSWGDPPFALTFNSNSRGDVSFGGSAFKQDPVRIAGNVVTLWAAPSVVTLTATQAASGNYGSYTAVTTLTILGTLPDGYLAKAGLSWSPEADGYTWNDAERYCAQASFLGVTGWRLPTATEIDALRGEWRTFGTQPLFLWTATPVDTGSHWILSTILLFPESFRLAHSLDSELNGVTCVRE